MEIASHLFDIRELQTFRGAMLKYTGKSDISF
jgi:hypothetical protein